MNQSYIVFMPITSIIYIKTTPAHFNTPHQRTGETYRLAPLLFEAGRFEGRGSDPVFDPGGSVAEWIIGSDGAGKLIGGSADRPADSKATAGRASEAYRGFRVVKGPVKN